MITPSNWMNWNVILKLKINIFPWNRLFENWTRWNSQVSIKYLEILDIFLNVYMRDMRCISEVFYTTYSPKLFWLKGYCCCVGTRFTHWVSKQSMNDVLNVIDQKWELLLKWVLVALNHVGEYQWYHQMTLDSGFHRQLQFIIHIWSIQFAERLHTFCHICTSTWLSDGLTFYTK